MGKDLPGPAFVRRVDIRMEEADGYRPDPFLLQRPGDLAHRLLIQGRQHVPIRVEPLGDAEGEVAGYERWRLLELEVIEARPDLPGDLEHVTEAVCGHEPRKGRLALDDRVGGDRRGVNQVLDRRRGDAAVRHYEPNGVQEPARKVVWGGWHLAGTRLTRLLVQQHGVGEGSADIDAQAIHRTHSLGLRPVSRKRAVAEASARRMDGSSTTL